MRRRGGRERLPASVHCAAMAAAGGAPGGGQRAELCGRCAALCSLWGPLHRAPARPGACVRAAWCRRGRHCQRAAYSGRLGRVGRFLLPPFRRRNRAMLVAVGGGLCCARDGGCRAVGDHNGALPGCGGGRGARGTCARKAALTWPPPPPLDSPLFPTRARKATWSARCLKARTLDVCLRVCVCVCVYVCVCLTPGRRNSEMADAAVHLEWNEPRAPLQNYLKL
mmetsp:Transcript_9169/g.27920  ORF Transcript_9169/g.27920 Transcript_9169/m.27920 type:complete len:224 (+) Transcript_9169:719-1390(+)